MELPPKLSSVIALIAVIYAVVLPRIIVLRHIHADRKRRSKQEEENSTGGEPEAAGAAPGIPPELLTPL